MDIKWLQRDLGLYVVGLFDTFHAANALNFPGKSLKYLLERFANFKAQKKYQMADWRVRPLPAELVEYARSDTHYLLYIYDELKNMLLLASSPQQNLIDVVLDASKKEALQVYERPIYDVEYGLGSGGWFKQVTQRSIKFDGPQLAVYKAVHFWRDQKAREWDEGEQSILTLAQLYGIAELMPTTVPALYSSLRPISKLVATNAKEVVSVIKKAKAQGESGPSLRDVVRTTEEKFGPSIVWGRKAQKSPPAESMGVGSTLQMLAQSGDVKPITPEATTIVDDAELNARRSLTSRLWGSSLLSTNDIISGSAVVGAQALRSILPLPEKSETIQASEFVSVPMQLDQIDSPAPAVASPSPIIANGSGATYKITDSGELFTLRDRKRKAEPEAEAQAEAEADPKKAPSIDDVRLSVEDQARKEEKKRRKAEKRAQKEAGATAAAQVQPFDYASAQSMLHAMPDEEEQKRHKNKLVNPYAKALNTSTGARRTNQEGPGRSYTFKE